MKGATFTSSTAKSLSNISIHAPMKGATLFNLFFQDININFNPRTHEGCDEFEIENYYNDFIISIHAPMKGATLYILNVRDWQVVFQSTHP